MGAETEIAWCDATFNPWWGCAKVSPACDHCYAEAFAKRTGHDVWGVESPRRTLSAANWLAPLKWDRVAASRTSDHKPRVFCASMADVCEDRRDLDAPRAWLAELIRRTPNLQWLLLSKRPKMYRRLLPDDVLEMCWVGTTVEDQKRADLRIKHLARTPARKRFLSCEPLLESIDLNLDDLDHRSDDGSYIDWVIVGGESGGHSRIFDFAHARAIQSQCEDVGAAFFLKQGGSCALDTDWNGLAPLRLRSRKGSDPSEWPNDLQVRQFPEASR